MPEVRPAAIAGRWPVLLMMVALGLAAFLGFGAGGRVAAQQATATPSPTATPDRIRLEDTDPKVLYAGTWDIVSDQRASGGQFHRSNNPNATMTLTFRGSFVTLIYRSGPDGGIARVSIDGQRRDDLNQFSASETFGREATYGGLAGDADHTLRIEVTGDRSAQATNSYVTVDAFVIPTPPPTPSPTPTPAPLRFEETDPALSFTGAWATVPDPRASGGIYRMSDVAGASVSLVFRGPEITWVHSVGPNRGIAAVFLDGQSQGNIDLYAATEQFQQITTFSNLSPGDHTIRIEVSGMRSGPSTGNFVDVDALVVRDAPVRPQPTPVLPTATPTPTPTLTPTILPVTPTPTPTMPPAPTAVRDARYFLETRFRVDHDPFWAYFLARGGVDTFGYPVSRTILFLGCTTQFFQRQLLQQCGGGPVQTMNLLDPDLMPYSQINFSVFPAHDPAMATAAPPPGTPNYGVAVLAHIQRTAPDSFEGLPVRFFTTFVTTVPGVDPGTDPALAALVNLELWGFPTSRPAYDPSNRNFVYQRFQRGILHYDHSNRVTRGILLADWFKSILTGQQLPADLAQQAQGSRFFRQYCPGSPQWVCRPAELPATDLTFAFEPQ